MERHKFFYLFVTLVAFMVLYPLSVEYGPYTLVLNLLFSAIFLVAVYAVSRHEFRFHIALSLGIPWLSLRWFNYLVPNELYGNVGIIFEIAFFLFIVGAVLMRIANARHIAADIIFGAISVYLMMGILWASAFAFIEALAPGSFAIHSLSGRISSIGAPWHHFLFFSFTTLTTLGYGDITPVRPFAQAFAALEAITGLLYVTVLIARLSNIYGHHRENVKR